jgi:hypothetical protein
MGKEGKQRMSIEIAIKTCDKKEVAEILRRIADLIAISTNQTVDVTLDVRFNKKGDC